jgi:hypothetical protein
VSWLTRFGAHAIRMCELAEFSRVPETWWGRLLHLLGYPLIFIWVCVIMVSVIVSTLLSFPVKYVVKGKADQ